MSVTIIILFLFFATITGLIRWTINKRKNFKDLIEPKLKQHGLKYISSAYPGVFRVGPFNMIKVEVGKPQINKGRIQYEHTYYRKVIALTSNNLTKEIWAKIETSWFKDSTVEFKPDLNEL